MPVYGSGGFTSYDEKRLRTQLGHWVEAGITRVKMKVGRDPRAALRCVGVGKCRRHEHGTMCPSYMVLKEEKHTTRGPAVREADDDTVILTDGFSCLEQILQQTGRRPLHLAELIRQGLQRSARNPSTTAREQECIHA